MSWYDGLWNVPIDLVGNKNRRKLAKMKNAISFRRTFMRLAEDALDRYDIEGLPDTISKRVILQSLLWHANVTFFDKNGNLFALPSAPSGELNVYGEPAMAEVYSLNGMFNEPVNLYLPGSDMATFLDKRDGIAYAKAKGVMIWENKQRYPFIDTAIYYAEQISDTMRTLEVLRQNAKMPQIFFAEESVVDTVKKFLTDREDNVEAVVSTGIFPVDKVKSVPIDNSGTAISDITALIEWYESKYRELCGKDNNSQMDKKGENLIEAEVSVNDEYTEASVTKCLEVLNEGADYVNKLFGTNIKFVEKGEQGDGEDVRTDDSGRESDVSDERGLGAESNNI